MSLGPGLARRPLPIINPGGGDRVAGSLLTFTPELSEEAYRRVSAMEPAKHYLWKELAIGGKPANLLIGRSPTRGSVACEEKEWNGWSDPLFTVAIDVVEETLQSENFSWDLKSLFKLQMAYLLLWSSIERYLSLRYCLDNNVMRKISQIASEKGFSMGLRDHVQGIREVYRADSPREKIILDPQQPDRAIQYYYQVRSNIIHRGKAAIRDFDIVSKSLSELLKIFRTVLTTAQQDIAPRKVAKLTLF
ncbi:MAG: hypothetical protein U1E38_05160 [Rhodospirillales bacterium]